MCNSNENLGKINNHGSRCYERLLSSPPGGTCGLYPTYPSKSQEDIRIFCYWLWICHCLKPSGKKINLKHCANRYTSFGYIKVVMLATTGLTFTLTGPTPNWTRQLMWKAPHLCDIFDTYMVIASKNRIASQVRKFHICWSCPNRCYYVIMWTPKMVSPSS